MNKPSGKPRRLSECSIQVYTSDKTFFRARQSPFDDVHILIGRTATFVETKQKTIDTLNVLVRFLDLTPMNEAFYESLKKVLSIKCDDTSRSSSPAKLYGPERN